jgi:uncharacterized protein YecE (DUF72 family)
MGGRAVCCGREAGGFSPAVCVRLQHRRRQHHFLRLAEAGERAPMARGNAAEVPDDDFYTLDAKRRKPKVPVRFLATNQFPFVRFVGHPVIENNEFHLLQWASAVVKWLEEGKRPYVFMHAPDDFYAPHLARYFHALVCKISKDAGQLPLWPSEKERTSVEQLKLF